MEIRINTEKPHPRFIFNSVAKQCSIQAHINYYTLYAVLHTPSKNQEGKHEDHKDNAFIQGTLCASKNTHEQTHSRVEHNVHVLVISSSKQFTEDTSAPLHTLISTLR